MASTPLSTLAATIANPPRRPLVASPEDSSPRPLAGSSEDSWARHAAPQIFQALAGQREFEFGEIPSASQLGALKLWMLDAVRSSANAVATLLVSDAPDGAVWTQPLDNPAGSKLAKLSIDDQGLAIFFHEESGWSKSPASFNLMCGQLGKHGEKEVEDGIFTALGLTSPSQPLDAWLARHEESAQNRSPALDACVVALIDALKDVSIDNMVAQAFAQRAGEALLRGSLAQDSQRQRARQALIGAPKNEGFELAWSQTPQAASLAAVLGRAMDPSLPLRADAPKQAKELLKTQCALTDAGWRALGRVAEDPEFAPRAQERVKTLPDDFMRIQAKAYWMPLADGTEGPGPIKASVHALCQTASFCAGAGIDLGQALRWAFSDWMPGAGCASGGEKFVSLFTIAPIAAREILELQEKGIRRKPGRDQDLIEMVQTWEQLSRRFDSQPSPFIEPGRTQEWTQKGWTPQTEPELAILAFERDRLARQAKGFPLFCAALKRGAKQGFNDPQFEQDVSSILDFLAKVELGFWEQHLPKDPSWSFIKRAADAWHDQMALEKASSCVWEPLFGDPIHDVGERWIARELVNGGQLHAEGKRMRHCVSSYAEDCAQGRKRIFSLESTDGHFKSTIELQPDKQDPTRYVDAQHRAFANSSPTLGAKMVAARLIRQINQRLEAASKPSLSRS